MSTTNQKTPVKDNVAAAKWLLVGFKTNWGMKVLYDQLEQRGLALPDFLPARHELPSDGISVRFFVSKNWSNLFEFLCRNSLNGPKMIGVAEEVARLRYRHNVQQEPQV